jgi:hypothetical protein
MSRDPAQKAVNRIGWRMWRWTVTIAVVFGWIIMSTNSIALVCIDIALVSGNIIGNMIYMYVVSRSYDDDGDLW